MNRNDIERILAIAETGSMAKASQKLFLTQPALSKCLTRVEEELGEPLFIRRPSGLLLTHAGQCFISKAQQILKLYNDVEIEFCELNHMRKGVLKLGIAERLGALVLPDLLCRFNRRYPNIQIDILEESSFLLEEKVMSGVLDIAILCLPLKNLNIRYQVFYEEPVYFAVPKDHPVNQLAYKKDGADIPFLSLEALNGQDIILTDHSKKTRLAADRILKQTESTYNIKLEFHNIETVIRLVANGMGISLIPDSFSKTYLTGGAVNYYQIEQRYNPFWQWAVIYDENIDTLTRPSRELFHILCEEGFSFPDYLC
ncbi:MAG: LysR family transcriptional regulator [Clostridiales bacterium]|nr:LysR family transcriptional regulator [Clostridiales bacterium]